MAKDALTGWKYEAIDWWSFGIGEGDFGFPAHYIPDESQSSTHRSILPLSNLTQECISTLQHSKSQIKALYIVNTIMKKSIP
jgi:hypothetical protein